jgi:hypothetical protein
MVPGEGDFVPYCELFHKKTLSVELEKCEKWINDNNGSFNYRQDYYRLQECINAEIKEEK